jgi:hypothetical protein
MIIFSTKAVCLRLLEEISISICNADINCKTKERTHFLYFVLKLINSVTISKPVEYKFVAMYEGRARGILKFGYIVSLTWQKLMSQDLVLSGTSYPTPT